MSGVARLVAKIETEMGVEVEQDSEPESGREPRASAHDRGAAVRGVASRWTRRRWPHRCRKAPTSPALLAELQQTYEGRGVNLVCVAGKWQFRTASDLAFLLRKEQPEQRRLSRAAIETLAIIAYHQPVTRAEIEDIRGVMLSKGTFDVLMEVGWVKIRGRKRTPGRPVTFGTTEAFLVQFGLESVNHLPGVDELKAAGFLEAIPPSGFDVPSPTDELGPDEDPFVEGEDELDLATGGPD